MNSTSASVWMNSKHRKKDGTCAIYLQVIINRKTIRYNTHVSWPPGRFDAESGMCLPVAKGDTMAGDYNLVLQKMLAKANEIFVRYRLSDMPLTHASFKKEFESSYSRQSFVEFFKEDLEERRRTRSIAHETYRSHLMVWRKLAGYPANTFADFNNRWAESFASWLRKRGLAPNSIWNHHKTVKTYMLRAQKARHVFIFPYENYKIREARPNVACLSKEELEKLLALYKSERLDTVHQHVLRRFLWSCFTGMRIGDMLKLTYQEAEDGLLWYIPHKTKASGKHARMPITEHAQQMLTDARKYFARKPWAEPGEQYSNRVLKRIAVVAEINTRMTHHVGRHTFADIFLKLGGSVVVLKELMCHTSVNTTMRYSHVDDQNKAEEMRRFNSLG